MNIIDKKFRNGKELYGDKMSLTEVERWYADEEHAYYDLASEGHRGDYGYKIFNQFHGFSALKGRFFENCIALGCADGMDVETLSSQVGHFYAIEPAEKWWSDKIAGVPATFLKPSIFGHIDLPEASADLATSFGVLHHIPTVGTVISEVGRLLKSGGIFIVREPAHAMGDWTKPRPGLTARERGIPPEWLRDRLHENGFKIKRFRNVMSSVTGRIFRGRLPYNKRSVVIADWILSESLSWNNYYWRDTLLKKFAPTSTFVVAEKV